MNFQKAICNGVHSKRLANGNTVYYYQDTITIFDIIVDDNLNVVDCSFVEGSKPALELLRLVKNEVRKHEL